MMLMGQVGFKFSLKILIWQCDILEVIAVFYKYILGE